MQKMDQIICFLFCITLPIMTASADNKDKIGIHGFVSQGYLKTNHNNYLLDSEDGSFEFNEAAVNFSTQLTNNLRLGLQLFSRDFGSVGNNAFFLDWAYGDYHFQDEFGVRLGKIKVPVGLNNQERDVDLLRNPIILPQSVYWEGMRDFTLAIQGLSAYGSVSLKNMGRMDYEFFGGSLTVPEPKSLLWQQLFYQLTDTINQQLPEGSKSKIRDPAVNGEYVIGGSIKWSTPLSGLRLATSYATGKVKLSSDVEVIIPIAEISPGVNLNNVIVEEFDADVKFDNYNTYSLEYSLENFKLVCEYLFQGYEVQTIEKTLRYEGQGYYGQINYRPLEWMELSSYYSIFYPRKSDKNGDQLVQDGNPRYMAWQKDACFTLRFDLNINWLIKFEAHFIDGCGQVFQVNNPDGMERYFNLYGVKTTYNF